MKPFNAYTCKHECDMSRADVVELVCQVRRARSILEFGVGGSSYLLHDNAQDGANIEHFDTSPEWITRVRERLPEAKIYENPATDGMASYCKGRYDLILIDGQRDLRASYATAFWTNLDVGGVMLIHDCRRMAFGIDVAFAVINSYYNEIEAVHFSINRSNFTRIIKGESVEYENWHETEAGNGNSVV
jgi:hypothetical protein